MQSPRTPEFLMIWRHLLLLTAIVTSCRAVPPTDRPSTGRAYLCKSIGDHVITIDGTLEDTAWAHADVMRNFQTTGATPRPARYGTTVRLLWNSTHLFVAFECNIDIIRSTAAERDSAIFNSETAELFLCPNGPERPYFEIDVNPQNSVYDTRVLTSEQAVHWKRWQEWAHAFDVPLQSATTVIRNDDGHVTGWNVEIAIPFDSLALDTPPPQPGTTWRFNVHRVAHGSHAKEYSSWTPTYAADFHHPHRFPQLTFVTKRKE